MQQSVTIAPPRSRFRAALYGLAPGIAMIAIAMGFRLDPRSASAFSGGPSGQTQFSAPVQPASTTGASGTAHATGHAQGTNEHQAHRSAGGTD